MFTTHRDRHKLKALEPLTQLQTLLDLPRNWGSSSLGTTDLVHNKRNTKRKNNRGAKAGAPRCFGIMERVSQIKQLKVQRQASRSYWKLLGG